MNSCQTAFDELRRTQGSFFPSPQYGQQGSQPAPPMIPNRAQYEPSYTGGGREIRPKPTASASSSGQYRQPPTDPPAKRKRGRPTKASIAERAQAEAQRRGEYTGLSSTPGPQMSPPLMISTTQRRESVEELRPSLPPSTTRMPISAVLTPTAPKSASHSGSSSGKRKRRATRTEADEGKEALHEYETPSGPRAGTMEELAARPAIYDPREDTTAPSQTSRPPTHRESPDTHTAPET